MIPDVAAAQVDDSRSAAVPGYPPGQPAESVLQDADGWVWIGGTAGLFRFDGERCVRWGGPDAAFDVDKVVRVDAGVAIVHTAVGGVWRLTRGARERLSPPGDPPIASATADPSGGWLGLAAGEVWRFSEGWTDTRVAAREGERLTTADGAVFLVGGEGVRALGAGAGWAVPNANDVDRRDGATWITTWTGEVWRADGAGAPRRLHPPGGTLPGDERAESVVATPDGAWVATTRGLLRFRDDRLAYALTGDRLAASQTDGLALDRDGTLWVAAWRGPRRRTSPDTVRLRLLDGGPTFAPWAWAVGSDVWFGQWGGGGWIPQGDAGPPRPRWIGWPPCTTADGAVWAPRWEASGGETRATLVRLREGTGDEPRTALAVGLGGGGCAAGPDGTIWIAGDAGIARLPPGAPAPTPLPDAPAPALRVVADAHGWVHAFTPDQECHAPAADAIAGRAAWACHPIPTASAPEYVLDLGDRIWVAARDQGILEERDGAWRSLPAARDLSAPTVTGLAAARAGGAWIVAGAEALRVLPDDGPAGWRVVQRVDAPGDEGLSMVADGPTHAGPTVLLASPEGLFLAPDPGAVPPAVPGAPEVEDLWIDGRSTAPADASATPLSWLHNLVELRAATPSLLDQARLRWRIRTGPGEPWSEPSRAPTFQLLDLPAGEHTLEVQAGLPALGGAEIAWSAPSAPVALTVPLPWALRPGWIALYVLTFSAGLVAAWRWRVRQLLRLAEERHRISMDLHDDLGAGLSTIAMLTGLAGEDGLDEAARKEVTREAAQVAASLGASLSDIVWALRRDAGAPASLGRALAERARRLFPAGDVRVTTEIAADWPVRSLPLRTYRAALLIGAEALTNAARHAAPTRVHLRLQPGRPWVLEITDDGRGLQGPSPRAGTGAGLENMRARAREAGGTLVVGPAEGGGTRVRFTFPV